MSNIKIIHYAGSIDHIDRILSIHYFEESPTVEEVNAIVKPLTPYARYLDTGKGIITDYGSYSRFLFKCPVDVEVKEGMDLIEY